MTVERWHRSLRSGAFCTVAVPTAGPPRYAYCRLLANPCEGNNDILVRLHEQTSPIGKVGLIPLDLILTEMHPDFFDAARKTGFPSNVRSGMLLANQTTGVMGKS